VAYSVEADLNLSEQRLVELTDSEDVVGVKDAVLIERLHVRATSKVDAALYGKYTTPVVPTLPILTQLEADLWRYYLYEHREVMDTPKVVQKAFDMAIDLLERYRTGMEHLAGARTHAATDPIPTEGSFSSDSDSRLFGRCKDGLF
jgi:phage gp36-like protein